MLKTERNDKDKIPPHSPTPTAFASRHTQFALRPHLGHPKEMTKKKNQKHREAKSHRQIQTLRPLVYSARRGAHTGKQVCGSGEL